MKNKLFYAIIPLAGLLLFGCGNKADKYNAPETRRDTTVINYFGTGVADPFGWLENGDSPEVRKWIEAQNNYADKVLDSFAEGKIIEKRIKELGTTSVEQYQPKYVDGKIYFNQLIPPQAQAVIAYKPWPEGETKVLVDPNKMGDGIAITGFWPSPEGTYLAYGTAKGGDEATSIHIYDISKGKELPDTLFFAGGGTTPAGMVWDADEKGLTYVRLPIPGTVPQSESQFAASLYHHKLGQPVTDDDPVLGQGMSRVAEYTFIPSADGKQAAVFVHFGDGNPDFVYIRKNTKQWIQVLDTTANVRVSSEFNSGASWDADNNLLVVAYQDAPLGKLLSINPKGSSTVIIPQNKEWAYNSVSAVKGGLLLVKVKGPEWKIDQYDSQGKFIRNVDLPKQGIGIDVVASAPQSSEALITYSGWNFPERWDQYNADTGELRNVFEVKPAADYSNVSYKEIEAVSKDGTKIPVTVLYKKGVTPDGKRPTIVYGYGGFGVPTKPRFIGPYLVWLENGGVFAYANIRGGGEFGEGWHEAGMLANKQNVFDDMYAASEAMVKNNWTDNEHLGIMGGSNGGLLMGALLTQHPEAFKAVVSFVGIYDMIRNELFPNGEYNVSEYGTSKNESDFNWLYAYSPYHNIKQNTPYPAILLETGINDPRVASWQSRKFAAALQDANTSGNPILLLTRMNEGHGVTASFSQRIGNYAASLTFFAHELGLKIE